MASVRIKPTAAIAVILLFSFIGLYLVHSAYFKPEQGGKSDIEVKNALAEIERIQQSRDDNSQAQKSEDELAKLSHEIKIKEAYLKDLAERQGQGNKALEDTLKVLQNKQSLMSRLDSEVAELSSKHERLAKAVADSSLKLNEINVQVERAGDLKRDLEKKAQEVKGKLDSGVLNNNNNNNGQNSNNNGNNKKIDNRVMVPEREAGNEANQGMAQGKDDEFGPNFDPLQPERRADPKLTPSEIKALEDASFKKHMFNEYKSSLQAMNRPVPEVRIPECKGIKYDVASLPPMSVIICFVDEAWSALLRTVWSVLNRTPANVLQEIILVDDASNADWLGQRLITYARKYFPSKVRIIRSETRLGLIRARLFGANNATAPVLTFLDSHCEATEGWSEPILQLIKDDRTTVVTPVIDSIDHHTMEYASWVQRVPAVGTFSWTMDFTWKTGKHRPGQKITDAVDSPTMAGGLFSIEALYFKEIGTYDQTMDGWGGENLEMSFRIWQCHGKLVSAPCSHVGHIFRDSHPYTVPGTSIHDTFTKNSLRVAEVWMDDYKQYFYNTRPDLRKYNFGDISSRLELRKALKCKPFKWYMDTLLPDMFIPDEKHILHKGALKNSDGNCVDKMGNRHGGVAGVYPCHGLGTNQAFMYSIDEEIRHIDELCLDAWGSLPAAVNIQRCHGQKGNQKWVYVPESGIFRHAGTNGCLESFFEGGKKVLKVATCNGTPAQKWTWSASGH